MLLLVIFTWYVLEKPAVTEFVMGHWSGRQVYIAIFIVGGILLCFYWWATGAVLREPVPPALSKGEIKQAPEAKAEDAPTLLVQYTQGMLPIQVPSQSSVFVLPLSPFINEHTDEIANRNNSPMWWPANPRAQNQFQIGQMYECRLTNHGDKALLDISVVFNVSFLSVGPASVVITKNPDGTQSVSTERPGGDRSVFIAGRASKPLVGRSGEVISTHKHVVTIPAIPAHGTALLYFVSMTKYFSRFDFPSTATAIVDGNPSKRLAVLVRPAMSPVDMVPFWMLPPSLYEWPHVKESILEQAIPFARDINKR